MKGQRTWAEPPDPGSCVRCGAPVGPFPPYLSRDGEVTGPYCEDEVFELGDRAPELMLAVLVAGLVLFVAVLVLVAW